MYKSKHFVIEELVPQHIFEKRGKKAWQLINPNLIEMIDRLKDIFPQGSMSINTYKWGGDRNWSGLRTANSPYYSETSQHSLGNAIDCIFSEYTTSEVRQYIIDNPDEFPYIKGIEIATWLHIDCRNSEEVLVFTP